MKKSSALLIIEQAIDQGMSTKDIAKVCGVHIYTVTKWIKIPHGARYESIEKLKIYINHPNRVQLKYADLETILKHLFKKWPNLKNFSNSKTL